MAENDLPRLSDVADVQLQSKVGRDVMRSYLLSYICIWLKPHVTSSSPCSAGDRREGPIRVCRYDIPHTSCDNGLRQERYAAKATHLLICRTAQTRSYGVYSQRWFDGWGLRVILRLRSYMELVHVRRDEPQTPSQSGHGIAAMLLV